MTGRTQALIGIVCAAASAVATVVFATDDQHSTSMPVSDLRSAVAAGMGSAGAAQTVSTMQAAAAALAPPTDELLQQLKDTIQREDDPLIKAEMERVLRQMQAEVQDQAAPHASVEVPAAEAPAAVAQEPVSAPSHDAAAPQDSPAVQKAMKMEQVLNDPRLSGFRQVLERGEKPEEVIEAYAQDVLHEYGVDVAAVEEYLLSRHADAPVQSQE